jgi:hypothetical protein
MPQQPAQLSEVNQVLNAKVQKRTMKLAEVNHALQAEIRGRQPSKAGSGNWGSAALATRLSFFTDKTYAPGIRNPVFLRKNLVRTRRWGKKPGFFGMCASRTDRSSNFRRGITGWQIKLNVLHGELVTAALGGTRSGEGSLRQQTIALTLSDGGFHFGELKNPVSEWRSASRRGRNLSESGFLSFCLQCCLLLRNSPPACSPKA